MLYRLRRMVAVRAHVDLPGRPRYIHLRRHPAFSTHPWCFRMTPVERPLSPHLQIYKPQLTSVLSISHRGAGLALSVGTIPLVWWLVAAASGDQAFAAAQAFWGSWIGVLFLLGWTY